MDCNRHDLCSPHSQCISLIAIEKFDCLVVHSAEDVMNVVGVSPVGVRPAPVPITRNVRTVPRCSIETGEWKETRKRSVVILPGLGNSEADYAPLATALKSRGLAADIAAVRRIDWLRNALGLADINYWKGTLKPRPVVDWYFKLVEEAVERAKRETDGAPITLLAHSAGGWLGRLYLLNFGTAGIDRLVTLGTPHQPPPPESPMPDQTRGILTYVRDSCPGNYHPEINYVTVAGKAVEGAKFGDRKASLFRQLVGAGYLTVCGSADVWGDGIVPLPAAHLEGAEQITLEGVYHSPVGAKDDSQRQGGGAPVG
eukprot:jgi/Botrbrau1/15094/Bobra.0255s0007.1